MGYHVSTSILGRLIPNERGVDSHFADIQQAIMAQQMQCHENMLKRVLSQLLKREPIPQDAKRLTRYTYEGVFEYYDLSFDGVKIGRVSLNNGVNFEPNEKFK